VSGSGISWATCKSAPRSRQITTPAPHHSVFTGRMPFLPPKQQRQSTEDTQRTIDVNIMPNSHRYTRHDKTVLSVSCPARRFDLDYCCTCSGFKFSQSATVLSCRESSSHRRSGRDTDKTVLSCPAWQCESASTSRYHGAADDGRRF